MSAWLKGCEHNYYHVCKWRCNEETFIINEIFFAIEDAWTMILNSQQTAPIIETCQLDPKKQPCVLHQPHPIPVITRSFLIIPLSPLLSSQKLQIETILAISHSTSMDTYRAKARHLNHTIKRLGYPHSQNTNELNDNLCGSTSECDHTINSQLVKILLHLPTPPTTSHLTHYKYQPTPTKRPKLYTRYKL